MEYEKLVKVCEKVEKKLNEERLGGEVWVHGNGLPVFDVHISWGDWKHDHGWLDSLMGYIDYEAFNEIVTEENGSDCYSSEHIFVRKDAEKLQLLHELQKLFR